MITSIEREATSKIVSTLITNLQQMSYFIKVPNIINISRWIGLSIFLMLQSCSTNKFSTHDNFNSDMEAQIQVCLPTKRVYFKDITLDQLENHPLFTKYSQQQLQLAPKTVRRVDNSNDHRAIRAYGIGFGAVLIRDGQFSDGSGFLPLRDSTVSNQPVYEQKHGYPARNYVAIHVNIPDSDKETEDRVTYWFTLPKNIPNDRFTDWLNPISMEPEKEKNGHPKIWWRLTHGEAMIIYPVSIDSPKMRVLLKKNIKEEHNDPAADTLPALTTARIKYKTATSGRDFVYEFIPKNDQSIPTCD
jgi:hypothetical protein